MTTELMGDDAQQRLPDHTVLGPYRLVQHLGEGGMGVVHLALDKAGRAVAIKVLRPHIGHDPVARARLRREVETLSRIQHAGVASVLDADLDGDRPYIVTRYVPGPALDDVVGASGPLEGTELSSMARGLAEALDAIHDAGVIHRDVKPGNVLIVDGAPVLIDFGIAHIADDIRLTSTGLVMGTPGYLSPEVVEGADVTEATDWWGWAATVAYAALGRPPFGTGPMEVVLSRVTRGDFDLRGVNPQLAPLLAAALDPDPTRRPDVDEVIAGLEAVAAGRDATEALTIVPPVSRTQVMPTLPPTVPQRPVAPPTEPVYAPLPPRRQESPLAGFVDAEEPEREQAGQTWLGGVEHADPRIGRPNRSGVLTAMLLAIVAAAAVAPLLTGLFAVLWSVFARTADRSITQLVLRRHANGARKSDVAVGVVATPWHFVIGLVSSVVALLLPLAVGISAVVCSALGLAAALGTEVKPASAGPLAIGAFFAALVAWWGPAGAGLRRGSRSIVRGFTRGDALRQALTALLILAAIGCAALALTRGGTPFWVPASGAPETWSWLIPGR